MRTVHIVDAVRTPIGRYGGALAAVRPDDLGAIVIREIVRRTGVDPGAIDDVIFGCANQSGEDNRNVARMSALLAGLPPSVPGATVNRLCGSGLNAINDGARAIAVGDADLLIAGGVESMSRAPLVMAKPREAFPRGDVTMADTTLGWRFVNPRMEALYGTHPLGETAELVAEKYQVTREAQDGFALDSQRRWAAAQAAGRFADELCVVELGPAKAGGMRGTGADGAPRRFEVDEHPRPETSAAALAALRPAFRKERGTVTAGNSSGINDGAAALLLASDSGLARLAGRAALARIIASAVAGVEPRYMGVGPIPATRKALARAGIAVSAIDLVELNEAFAAQALPCISELGLDPAAVNVNGGAIAIGHPLGCSGARLMTTLAHELRRRGGRYGLATMCIGVGQGISTIIERG
ncbi:MAG TPA: acetyl-CoA C-acyltransferase [Polyangia bacterium]|nr:acetyl-CoA C-acyltransferase [Polyangia bacterium]